MRNKVSRVFHPGDTERLEERVVLNAANRPAADLAIASLTKADGPNALTSIDTGTANPLELALSPDGSKLVVGSYNGSFKVIDPQSGAVLRTLQTPSTGWSSHACFSPDGKVLATGNNDGTLRIWNPDTGALLQSFGVLGTISAIEYSPIDANTIAIGDSRGIVLLNVQAGSQTVIAPGDVMCRFDPSGLFLYSGSTIQHKYDLAQKTGTTLKSSTPSWNNDMDVTADGRLLVIGENSGQITFVDTASGNVVLKYQNPVSVWSLRLEQNGKVLFVGGQDGSMRILDCSGALSGNAVTEIPGGSKIPSAITSMQVSQHGRTLYSVTPYTGQVVQRTQLPGNIWEALPSPPATVNPPPTLNGLQTSLTALQLSQQAQVTEYTDAKNQLQTLTDALASLQTQLTSATKDRDALQNLAPSWPKGPASVPSALGFLAEPKTVDVADSPKGDIVASAGSDGAVSLYAVSTGTLLKRVTVNAGNLTYLAFDPTGSTLAVGEYAKQAAIIDVASGTIKNTFPMPNFSAVPKFLDATHLAVVGADPGTDVVFNVTDGSKVTLPNGAQSYSLAVSPDGKTVYAGEQGSVINAYDAATGKVLGSFTGIPGDLWYLAASGDGQLLAATGSSNRVTICDTQTRLPLQSIQLDSYGMTVEFSADSQVLIVASYSGNVTTYKRSGQTFQLQSTTKMPGIAYAAEPSSTGLLYVAENGGADASLRGLYAFTLPGGSLPPDVQAKINALNVQIATLSSQVAAQQALMATQGATLQTKLSTLSPKITDLNNQIADLQVQIAGMTGASVAAIQNRLITVDQTVSVAQGASENLLTLQRYSKDLKVRQTFLQQLLTYQTGALLADTQNQLALVGQVIQSIETLKTSALLIVQKTGGVVDTDTNILPGVISNGIRLDQPALDAIQTLQGLADVVASAAVLLSPRKVTSSLNVNGGIQTVNGVPQQSYILPMLGGTSVVSAYRASSGPTAGLTVGTPTMPNPDNYTPNSWVGLRFNGWTSLLDVLYTDLPIGWKFGYVARGSAPTATTPGQPITSFSGSAALGVLNNRGMDFVLFDPTSGQVAYRRTIPGDDLSNLGSSSVPAVSALVQSQKKSAYLRDVAAPAVTGPVSYTVNSLGSNVTFQYQNLAPGWQLQLVAPTSGPLEVLQTLNLAPGSGSVTFSPDAPATGFSLDAKLLLCHPQSGASIYVPATAMSWYLSKLIASPSGSGQVSLPPVPSMAAKRAFSSDTISFQGGIGAIDLSGSQSVVTAVTGNAAVFTAFGSLNLTVSPYRGETMLPSVPVNPDGSFRVEVSSGITSLVISSGGNDPVEVSQLSIEGIQGGAKPPADAVSLGTMNMLSQKTMPVMDLINPPANYITWQSGGPMDNHPMSNLGWLEVPPVGNQYVCYTIYGMPGKPIPRLNGIYYYDSNMYVHEYPRDHYEVHGNTFILYPTGIMSPQPIFIQYTDGYKMAITSVGASRSAVMPPTGANLVYTGTGSEGTANIVWQDPLGPQDPNRYEAPIRNFGLLGNVSNTGLSAAVITRLDVHVGPTGTASDPIIHTSNVQEVLNPGTIAGLRIPVELQHDYDTDFFSVDVTLDDGSHVTLIPKSGFQQPHNADTGNSMTRAMGQHAAAIAAAPPSSSSKVYTYIDHQAARMVNAMRTQTRYKFSSDTTNMLNNIWAQITAPTSTGQIADAALQQLYTSPAAPAPAKAQMKVDQSFHDALVKKFLAEGNDASLAEQRAAATVQLATLNIGFFADKYGITFTGDDASIQATLDAYKAAVVADTAALSGANAGAGMGGANSAWIGAVAGTEYEAKADKEAAWKLMTTLYSATTDKPDVTGINFFVDRSTVVGKMFVAILQNANSGSIPTWSLAEKISTVTGIPQQFVFNALVVRGAPSLVTPAERAQSVRTLFETSQFGQIFNAAVTTPGATNVITAVVPHAYASGDSSIRLRFDFIAGSGTYDRGNVYLLDVAGNNIAPQTPLVADFRNQLYVDVPISSIASAYQQAYSQSTETLSARFKVALWPTVDSVSGYQGANSTPNPISIDLRLDDLSDNPDPTKHSIENSILTAMARDFQLPLYKNGGYHVDFGSPYHYGTKLIGDGYEALDINRGGGTADRGDEIMGQEGDTIVEIKPGFGTVVTRRAMVIGDKSVNVFFVNLHTRIVAVTGSNGSYDVLDAAGNRIKTIKEGDTLTSSGKFTGNGRDTGLIVSTVGTTGAGADNDHDHFLVYYKVEGDDTQCPVNLFKFVDSMRQKYGWYVTGLDGGTDGIPYYVDASGTHHQGGEDLETGLRYEPSIGPRGSFVIDSLQLVYDRSAQATATGLEAGNYIYFRAWEKQKKLEDMVIVVWDPKKSAWIRSGVANPTDQWKNGTWSPLSL